MVTEVKGVLWESPLGQDPVLVSLCPQALRSLRDSGAGERHLLVPLPDLGQQCLCSFAPHMGSPEGGLPAKVTSHSRGGGVNSAPLPGGPASLPSLIPRPG